MMTQAANKAIQRAGGDTVLTQGTGGVSLFAVQLAKAFGAKVISTTSSERKADRLRALGAGHVVDYTASPEWGADVRALTGGLGVDRVVEVDGPETLAQSIEAVALGDSISIVGVPKPQFIEKWAAKRAEQPRAGAVDIVATFLTRIERQKKLLAEFEADPTRFTSWRAAWFCKVAGGFGVSIGHDLIGAGGGLRYIVVETVHDVAVFLDDLGHHVQTDMNFQRALRESRLQRARRKVGATAP